MVQASALPSLPCKTPTRSTSVIHVQPNHAPSTTQPAECVKVSQPNMPLPLSPPPLPVAVQPVSGMLAPAEIYAAFVAASVTKSKAPLPKLILMGIASGM